MENSDEKSGGAMKRNIKITEVNSTNIIRFNRT